MTKVLERDKTMFTRWCEWHEAHPEFYKMFERLALQVAAAGHKECSVALLFERIRWEHLVRGLPADEIAHATIPNAYRSLFARLFLHHHPELPKFFHVMPLTAVSPEEEKLIGAL